MDLRLPIGYVFSIYGIILVVYGLVTKSDATMYAKSLGMNVNLLWGGVVLVFGLVMLFFAKKSSKS